jgi:transcriptional regulator with XRE-family HTH domain
MQTEGRRDLSNDRVAGMHFPAFPASAGASETSGSGEDNLDCLVGCNLRKLRTRHSLERLAKLSGVSRAMLSQIERGDSVPTITLLWKVARALEVPFAALMAEPRIHGTAILRAARSKVLVSQDGTFASRALFSFEGQRKVEFYELRLAPGGIENVEPHSPGTLENLVVNRGMVEIGVEGKRHLLTQVTRFCSGRTSLTVIATPAKSKR